MGEDLSLLLFSLQMALAATLVLLIPGVALAHALSHWKSPLKPWVETLLSLPLVLPPTAVGLLLLELFSRDTVLGSTLERWHLEVLFTPVAVVMAGAVMSFPLLVRSARSGFEAVDPRLVQVARTLGHGPWSVFFRVNLPLARRSIGAGALLAFSRALGEFGATILVAGNIPGRTQTMALAIFQRTQQGHDGAAMRLVGVAVLISFVAIFITERLTRDPSQQASA